VCFHALQPKSTTAIYNGCVNNYHGKHDAVGKMATYALCCWEMALEMALEMATQLMGYRRRLLLDCLMTDQHEKMVRLSQLFSAFQISNLTSSMRVDARRLKLTDLT
jgi:hypothetical protein